MVTGSLTERNGKYTAVISYYVNGKRKQKSIATGLTIKGNKRRAEELLEQYKQEFESERDTNAKNKTGAPLFADFLQEWLHIIKPTIERTTLQSYTNMIDARIDRHFRALGVTLAEVEPKHIRALYDEIFADDCTANTVIHYHAVIRKALQYAVRNELVEKNPADLVDRPKKNRYVSNYYNQDELTILFEVTKDDPLAVVIQLAAYYGLRRSEVLGLRWSAVNFERKTIAINHKVTEGKSGDKTVIYAEDKLKNKSSFRTLPLIPAVEALLLETKAHQETFRKLFKKNYDQSYNDYICVDAMGKLFRPEYVTSHFKWMIEKFNLRKIRFHDLRHSCASLLLAQSIPMKSIQEWMGHSTFATTADIYAHLDFNSKLESASAISGAFAKQCAVHKAESAGVSS